MTAAFDFSTALRGDAPAPAVLWRGFPKHNFVGGHNAPESIATDDLVAVTTRVLTREAPTLAMYRGMSGPQGYLPLREFLATKLKRQAGIDCSTDEILLTTGSTQAIDLVNKTLLAAGDTIVVEQSNYGGCLTRWGKLGINMVPVQVDDDGMCMTDLANVLDRLKADGIRPKFIYTIPTVQNPTASILPLARRHDMLRIAEQHDLAIFEDECYSDLIWSGERPPALFALDTSGRVIFTGTFSKSIAPALRVGYLVARWPFLSRAIAAKTDAGSGLIEQMILGEYCPDHFDAHVAKLNKLLESKLDVLIESLNENFGTSVEFKRPPGGIFLWLRLPDDVDTTKLTEVAGSHGIAINPGVEWSKDHPYGNRHIRVCYASSTADEIRDGIRALADVCHDTFGVPVRSANRART
ncbi:MAG: PLP-dependent aminotransferase family protein [Hyphomicrobiaceae bacterium]